jgi:hypothetical protein
VSKFKKKELCNQLFIKQTNVASEKGRIPREQKRKS